MYPINTFRNVEAVVYVVLVVTDYRDFYCISMSSSKEEDD